MNLKPLAVLWGDGVAVQPSSDLVRNADVRKKTKKKISSLECLFFQQLFKNFLSRFIEDKSLDRLENNMENKKKK